MSHWPKTSHIARPLYEKMRENKAKKLLQGVKETYNTIAEEFSDTRHTNWEEFEFFGKYIQPNSEILDLGCGNGRLIKFLDQKTVGFEKPAYHYLGVDNSENLLKKAQIIHPKQTFVLGDQLAIPVAENTIDLLFNIAAFHHLPDKKSQLQGLEEMKRVLKKDGYLFITVWNLWQKRYIKPIIKAVLKSIFSLGYYRFNDLFIPWGKSKIPRYYHAFLPAEFEKRIQESGLEIVEIFAVKNGQKVHLKESNNICLIARKI